MGYSPRVLEGKFAIISGTSRGIGSEIARHLAAKGCDVLGIYSSSSSQDRATKLAEELQSTYGVRACFIRADLGEPEANVPKVIAFAKSRFAGSDGKLTVNILVNNAGVGGDYKLEDVPIPEFYRMYNVNVLGPLVLTQAVVPYLPFDRSGRIINISSVASSMGFATHTLYGGTKAALEAMTRTWARELAERATVNAVNPGPVEGDMYLAAGEKLWKQLEPFQLNCPLSAIRDDVDDAALVELSKSKMGGRRPAYWSEVAGIVGMLCGKESAWCTGSIVCANGGFKFTC